MARRTTQTRGAIERHHAEWSSLVETSGPFPSLPVLVNAMPQGLEGDDPELVADLRLAYDEWRTELERTDDGAIHREWIRFVLRHVLEMPDEVLVQDDEGLGSYSVTLAEHHETLVPGFVLKEPKDDEGQAVPRLFVQFVSADQDLSKTETGQRWKVSPVTRMIELLRGYGESGVTLGLLTNGDQWILVHAPRGEPVGLASWWTNLWLEERLTFRAFRSLLGVARFFGDPDQTLENLYERSAGSQRDVTDQLGLQVRIAVETLVQTIDRIDRDRDRALLRDVDEKTLFEACVTFMMRLVFSLYAEEHDLLPHGDPFYDTHYAISTVHGQLQEDADRHGEEVLERRHAAWCRLLATFRAIHDGASHENFHLPAYGGGLFDPDRYPFFEGRIEGSAWKDVDADPLPIDDRTVLHLLTSIQYLSFVGSRQVESRRLSFKSLGVEQIGHVYESLLDHTAVRADEPIVSLSGSKGQEPEVELNELELARSKGKDALVSLLKELTKKQTRTLENALDETIEDGDGRWLSACDNDQALLERIRPFVGVIREDLRGQPVIIPPESVYVTSGTDRRSTGTHYTPPTLTEPIVKHTLDPLVYIGPAEGNPEAEWELKHPRDILALKVCDMAVGSGAFLVQACRYLAEKLVEAWERIEAENPGKILITPEGDLSHGSPAERPIPKDNDERLAIARRAIADRCLYGVDKNPMAVEMAKLSLWLITLQKGLPFEFLDHAIKCGDALLGVTSLEQVMNFHVDPARGAELFSGTDLFDVTGSVQNAVSEAMKKRQELEAFAVKDIRDAESKAALNADAEVLAESTKLVADLVIAPAVKLATSENARDAELEELAPLIADHLSAADDERKSATRLELARISDETLNDGNPHPNNPRRCFHWPIEFPEVLGRENPGFDALIGNPPFQGGQKITGEHGTNYRDYLVTGIAGGRRGSADLCAYFFLRARDLLRQGGSFGFLATNTIAQGDTREVGLDQITETDIVLYRAIKSQKWPGEAGVEVSNVWGLKGEWLDGYVLDDGPVPGITSQLSVPGSVMGNPFRLKANDGKSFVGSYVLGKGFVLEPEEAQSLVARNEKNKNVLFPYLNGEDLNSRHDQSPSRWVINFFDWPLDRSADGSWSDSTEEVRRSWLRDGRVPADYLDVVASDYPDCLQIIEEMVRPVRAENNRKIYRKRWWKYAENRPKLYSTIQEMERVLVCSQVSRNLIFAFSDTGSVFSHMTYVFPFSDWSTFSQFQSELHVLWAWKYSSSMRNAGIRYSPSDCFVTWPRPLGDVADVSEIGRRFYEAREAYCARHLVGLNKLHSNINDLTNQDDEIETLRSVYRSMNQEVLNLYGWSDLSLKFGFYQSGHSLRYTFDPACQAELLDRLLSLNHERYAEEVAAGLHDTESAKKKKNKQSRAARQSTDTRQQSLDLN